VDGDITSKTLVVEEGAVFQGQSIMDQQAQAAQAAPPASGAKAETASVGEAKA
jgi:cytoskeletal protein CcmA (bactofilin family)